MTEHTNTPELRFPVFKGEWEEKKLGDIGVFRKSYSFSRAKEGEGIYRHIHYGDIHSKLPEIVYDNNLLPQIKENKDFVKVQKGDLIFADASEDYDDLGKAITLDFNPQNIIAGLHTHLFTLEKNYDNKFLVNYTKTNKYRTFIRQVGTGISVLGISKKSLSNFNILTPFIDEQEKIGDFFSKLDRQIELEEEKLELLEQQKRGYMQKIFSRELRFKDDNGNGYPDWEETTIKNITNYINSKKSSNQYNESNNSEGYPVYDAIQEIGKDLQYDMKEPYISILKDGAGVGRLNLRAGKSSVIGTMGYIQAINVDIQFLYYRMKLLNFRKFIIGSTIPHLYYKDYSKEKILIPTSNDEQKKIGHFILNIDKLIDNKTLKLDYLKQRKQGLLQKMFI